MVAGNPTDNRKPDRTQPEHRKPTKPGNRQNRQNRQNRKPAKPELAKPAKPNRQASLRRAAKTTPHLMLYIIKAFKNYQNRKEKYNENMKTFLFFK